MWPLFSGAMLSCWLIVYSLIWDISRNLSTMNLNCFCRSGNKMNFINLLCRMSMAIHFLYTLTYTMGNDNQQLHWAATRFYEEFSEETIILCYEMNSENENYKNVSSTIHCTGVFYHQTRWIVWGFIILAVRLPTIQEKM